MRATGTSRLVVVSAAPVASDDHGTTVGYRLLAGPLLRTLLRGLYADLAIMEDTIIAAASTGRSCARRGSPAGPDGTYRQAKDGNLRGGYRISRADLAEAILAALNDPNTVKASIAIGH